MSSASKLLVAAEDRPRRSWDSQHSSLSQQNWSSKKMCSKSSLVSSQGPPEGPPEGMRYQGPKTRDPIQWCRETTNQKSSSCQILFKNMPIFPVRNFVKDGCFDFPSYNRGAFKRVAKNRIISSSPSKVNGSINNEIKEINHISVRPILIPKNCRFAKG